MVETLSWICRKSLPPALRQARDGVSAIFRGAPPPPGPHGGGSGGDNNDDDGYGGGGAGNGPNGQPGDELQQQILDFIDGRLMTIVMTGFTVFVLWGDD